MEYNIINRDGEVLNTSSPDKFICYYYKQDIRTLVRCELQDAQFILVNGKMYHPINFHALPKEIVNDYKIVKLEPVYQG